MALNVESITFDCDDPEKLADWWAQAVDGTIKPVAPGFFVIVSQPKGPQLAFQKVDDPTPGKNRVHVDFSAPTSRPRSSGWSISGRPKRGGTASEISAGWCWPTPPAMRSASPLRADRYLIRLASSFLPSSAPFLLSACALRNSSRTSLSPSRSASAM
jgi:hypothetical protein